MFDPWLISRVRLVNEIANNIIFNWDKIEPLRQRRHKAEDLKRRDTVIRSVIANLAFAAMSGIQPPAIGVSLRASKQKKRDKYDRPGFTGLPAIIETLGRHDLINIRKSSTKGCASKIEGPTLFGGNSLARLNNNPGDFERLPGWQTIYLSRTERDFAGRAENRELLNYVDTEETIRYRSEMERINAALVTADIRMAPDGSQMPVISDRAMRRVFCLPPDAAEDEERFDHGGRLFGGFWLNMPKARRGAIRIKGQPIADLDFRNMFLRLAYLAVGQSPPSGDLYEGILGPSAAPWRAGVKEVANAMLFRRTPLTRLPRETKGKLPPGISGSDIRGAVLNAHPALAPVFETGIGLRLMFTESQVLVATLLRLAEDGVPVLPMHDGLMAARSQEAKAIEAMQDAAQEVVGFRLPVASKAVEIVHE